MAGVVTLALDPGQQFVSALRQVWANGDAAFPLDSRLSEAEQSRIMAAVMPTAVIEADGEPRRLNGGRPTEPGDALVVATSGSTGDPKAVVLTHDAVGASATATSAALKVDPTSDRWLCCLPPAHIGGLSVITRAIVTDTPLEVHPTFDAAAVRRSAAKGTTLVSLVTRALSEVPATLFRRILLGGAAPPPDRPANVIATYGMTETGSGVVYERRPLDGVEIRIDQAGQIWVRGPMLLRAYRTPVGDENPLDGAGWFPTGDLGTFNPDGSLRVFGRQGDVIVTGGEKVWPQRVEPLLCRQPGVADAAVVGRQHPDWGHEVVALVVGTQQGSPTLPQLREAVKAELPVWYAPKALVLVPQLPRTALGKIQRDKLEPLL